MRSPFSVRRDSREASDLWRSRSGWRVGMPAHEVTVTVEDDAGQVHSAALPRAARGAEDATRESAVDADGWIWVHADGATHRLRPISRREAMQRRLAARELAGVATAPELRAPMPGAVVAVHAPDGARVAEGDRIVTIEAMKMEHLVTAPHSGILRVDVAVGDQVRRDQVLAHVTADRDSEHDPS